MQRTAAIGIVFFFVACGGEINPTQDVVPGVDAGNTDAGVVDAAGNTDAGVVDAVGNTDAGVDLGTTETGGIRFESYRLEDGDPVFNIADDYAGRNVGATSEKCHVTTELPRELVPEVLPPVEFRLHSPITELLAETFVPSTGYGFASNNPVDVDADGIEDMVVYGHLGSAEWGTRVYLGTPDGGYEPPIFPPWSAREGGTRQCFAFADIDGDAFRDVVCGGDSPGMIVAYYGTEEGLTESEPQVIELADESAYVNSVVVLPGSGSLNMFVATAGLNTFLAGTGTRSWQTIEVPSNVEGGEDTFYGFPIRCIFAPWCIVADNDGGRSRQEAYRFEENMTPIPLEDEEILEEPGCNVYSGATLLAGFEVEDADDVDWTALTNAVIGATGGEILIPLGLLSGGGFATPMGDILWQQCRFSSLSGTGGIATCLNEGTGLWALQPALTIPAGSGVALDGFSFAMHQDWGRRMLPTPTPVVITAWGRDQGAEDGSGPEFLLPYFGITAGEGYVGSPVGLHGLTTDGWEEIPTVQDRIRNNLSLGMGWSGSSAVRGENRLMVSSFDGTSAVYTVGVETPVLSIRLHGDPAQGVPTEGYGAVVTVQCTETEHTDSQKMGYQFVAPVNGNFTLGRMDFGVPNDCGPVAVSIRWAEQIQTETSLLLNATDQQIQDVYQE